VLVLDRPGPIRGHASERRELGPISWGQTTNGDLAA
jgi:hypothetical protein